MKDIFKSYLFQKSIFVAQPKEDYTNAPQVLIALGQMFAIDIVSGRELAEEGMIATAADCLGRQVPEAFYRGFPDTVRELTSDKLLFDQLVHYTKTYGFGDFSQPGHSIMEGDFRRLAFKERVTPKEFRIVPVEEGEGLLRELANQLLESSRPLSKQQMSFLQEYIREYDFKVEGCASKDTLIRLTVAFHTTDYARFLSLSDVIKVVEEINHHLCESIGDKEMKSLSEAVKPWMRYSTELQSMEFVVDNIRRNALKRTSLTCLNLPNRYRRLVTALIDSFFTTYTDACNVRECFERKALWNGLLHHIHYKPVNEAAAEFVKGIRGKGNISVYSSFEKAMDKGDIPTALRVLKEGKGNGALLRNLDYLLSRCTTPEDTALVIDSIEAKNPIILLQLIVRYMTPDRGEGRSFAFTKHNLLKVHKENKEEMEARKTHLDKAVRERVQECIRERLAKVYHNRLGKVYIDPGMRNIALPIQENTASGGYGVLPKGSRLPVPEGKVIRAFTYWERVNDIDLSVVAINEDGTTDFFSWQNMAGRQSDVITFSGDQTSGYNGGSEYFDVDVRQFRSLYPEARYLVFCNNVYSGVNFGECLCKAGYMLREEISSGEVFEPKTVQSSFTVNCESTFAYLFALDTVANEFIWLNLSRDSRARYTGGNSADCVVPYLNLADTLNLHQLFTLMATQVVVDPSEAEVIVSDRTEDERDGARLIHSYDIEAVMELMN